MKTMFFGQRADVREYSNEDARAKAFNQDGGVSSFGGHGTTVGKMSDDFDKGPLENYSKGDQFGL